MFAIATSARDVVMIAMERIVKMIDKYNETGIEPNTLEITGINRAKPITNCAYPTCERCDKYHGRYCTVPIVVNKQMWIEINDNLLDLSKRVTVVEDMVLDEIMSRNKKKKVQDEINFTWDDYLKEESE